MESNPFPALANAYLKNPSRILPESICPDKDLVLLFSKTGGVDRISLWNLSQGSNIWDADLGAKSSAAEVVGLSWSPDG